MIDFSVFAKYTTLEQNFARTHQFHNFISSNIFSITMMVDQKSTYTNDHEPH